MSSHHRKPAHQNKFAFKHNPNSKKTKKILKITHNLLCKRCTEQIEWRKKYRKYKPLKQFRKCNKCNQKNVKLAYHNICASCSRNSQKCSKCLQSFSTNDNIDMDTLQNNPKNKTINNLKLVNQLTEHFRERDRRKALRLYEKGELTYGEIEILQNKYEKEKSQTSSEATITMEKMDIEEEASNNDKVDEKQDLMNL